MLQGADWQVVEDGEGCEVREALSWKGWSPGLCTHSGLGVWQRVWAYIALGNFSLLKSC